jgi:DNA-binding response OmpR family regulator
MSHTHQRILWVEGNQDIGEMVTFFLERSDYFVTNAVTSVEAFGLARNGHFDLYLLGDWLPHGKESNLCEQIRKFDPHSPILFYSAAAYQADRQRGMDAGAQGYLTKPVGFDDLTAAISRLLNYATSDPDAER